MAEAKAEKKPRKKMEPRPVFLVWRTNDDGAPEFHGVSRNAARVLPLASKGWIFTQIHNMDEREASAS